MNSSTLKFANPLLSASSLCGEDWCMNHETVESNYKILQFTTDDPAKKYSEKRGLKKEQWIKLASERFLGCPLSDAILL